MDIYIGKQIEEKYSFRWLKFFSWDQRPLHVYNLVMDLWQGNTESHLMLQISCDFKHCNSNIKIEWICPSFWVHYRLIPTGNLRDCMCYWLNHFQRQWLHPNSLIGYSELLDIVPLSLSSLLFRRITLDYTKYALLFIMAVPFLRLFILSRILCFSFLPSSFSHIACLSSQAQCKSCFFSKTSINLFWAIIALHRPHTEFLMFYNLQSTIYKLICLFPFTRLGGFWWYLSCISQRKPHSLKCSVVQSLLTHLNMINY